MAKKKNEAPEVITLSDQELAALLERLDNLSITQADANLLKSILTMTVWIQQRLKRAKLSIKRLQKLFGFNSEASNKKKAGKSDSPEKDQNSGDLSANDDVGQSSCPPKKKPKHDPDQNHGRLAASNYVGCEKIDVAMDESFADNKCPSCLASGTVAKLYAVNPKVVIVLTGKPLISGQQYHLARLRCTVCQSYLTASLPEQVTDQRYQSSCATSIAIAHYYAGMPFNRLEMLQQAQGIPVPDATQYELVPGLYHLVVVPIFNVLRAYGANSEILYHDDTMGRILDQIQRHKLTSHKKAVHSTAIVGQYGEHRIYLFATSTKTAGAEFASLMGQRQVDQPILTMSDASSSNFPELEESLLCKWIISLCLAHSRRKFVELIDNNADEVKFILATMGRIYHHDCDCKQQSFNDEQRLAYHQQHSQPLMEAMRVWLNNLLKFNQTEPNSALGEAIVYLLKHWQGLTQFYRIAGAPLDNNLCEQAIKVFIRYRKNSLFYRTAYGANVGDAMMSVIHTAQAAGVNVFDYLNMLQAYHQSVNVAPEDWLPWNYQHALAKQGQMDAPSYAMARHADTS